MDKDIECPYCGHEQDIDHDDGHGCSEGEWEDQCEECEKYFIFTTSISFSHEAYAAPCLNDGCHVWRKLNALPRYEYWRNTYRCEDCGKEVKIYG